MSLRVFTFAPEWGLPTVGPFALKLLAWLELAGIPYEQVVEGNPRKGPNGKNPWIELDGERIGDSEIIIDLLKARHGVNLDEGLTPQQLALGHSWGEGHSRSTSTRSSNGSSSFIRPARPGYARASHRRSPPYWHARYFL